MKVVTAGRTDKADKTKDKKMIKICYFSGTGNTLWSAKKLAELVDHEAGTELINTGVAAQQDKIVLEADAVILLFPAYAYGAPLIFHNFVKKAVFKTPYVAVFVSYGTSPGGALAEIAGILKRKNIKAAYFGRIPAVENYIAIFGPPKDKPTQKRVEMQRKATEEAVRCVNERRTNRVNMFRPLSRLVSMFFSLAVKIFYRMYRISKDCDGCGICEKLCPVSAITLQDKRPVFSKKCQHCQGCLNWCPKRAIHFARLNSHTRRYHHPEINVSAILR